MHHEMKVWKSHLFELYYIVRKNQGFHECQHKNATVGTEKLRQKYIKINIDQHNLWKFTSLQLSFITSIETNMYQQPT